MENRVCETPTSPCGGARAHFSSSRAELRSVFLMANGLELGGTEKQLALLAQALDRRKFRVRLGCLRDHGPLADELHRDFELAEYDLGGGFFTRTALSAARTLARRLRSERIEVAHAFSFYSNVLMIPVARIAGVRLVIGSQRQLGDLLTPAQFTVQNALFRLCDRVVCNSRAAADRLTWRGLAADKITVIPNAVLPEIFRAAASRMRSQLPGVARIGMIARMGTRAKNHDLFLRAAARLRKRHPKTQFVLIGDGPLRPELERSVQKLRLASQVTFLGERRDVGEVLVGLDISVLTSSSESSPNAVTESMAAGLPVVSTSVGGAPELIVHGETGLLVPADDDACLADALDDLVGDPQLRRRLGQNARKFALTHFRMDEVCRRYEQLYLRRRG
jgi:L-malate glycosyltransferase